MNNQLNYVVYKHTSPSGKSYIGITNNYSNRTNVHKSMIKDTVFTTAINTYGWDNFTHEILYEFVSEEVARKLEIFEIINNNSLFPNGYNSQIDFGFCNKFANSIMSGDYEDFYKNRNSRKPSKQSNFVSNKSVCAIEYDLYLSFISDKNDSDELPICDIYKALNISGDNFRKRIFRGDMIKTGDKMKVSDIKNFYNLRKHNLRQPMNKLKENTNV